MKKCPFCAEKIQDEAIVCRFCGRDLKAVTPVEEKKPEVPVAAESEANPPIAVEKTESPLPKPKSRMSIWPWIVLGFLLLCLLAEGISFISSKSEVMAEVRATDQVRIEDATSIAERLGEMDAAETATEQVSISTITEPFSATIKLQYSSSGVLELGEDDYDSECSDGDYHNFVAKVKFTNPDATDRWYYRISFSRGEDTDFFDYYSWNRWEFTNNIYGGEEESDPINVRGGSDHLFKIVMYEEDGYLYMDGYELLNWRNGSSSGYGAVCIAAGYSGEDNSKVTTEVRYDDFRVWSFVSP